MRINSSQGVNKDRILSGTQFHCESPQNIVKARELRSGDQPRNAQCGNLSTRPSACIT